MTVRKDLADVSILNDMFDDIGIIQKIWFSPQYQT